MTTYDLPSNHRILAMPPPRARGGTRIVGKTYWLGAEPVTVVLGYGPCASVRNVRIRFEDGHTTVRPFRGLRVEPPT